MTQEQEQAWVRCDYDSMERAHSWAERPYHSSWDNNRDVCTICHQNFGTESENIEMSKKRGDAYKGLVFQSCKYCESRGKSGPFFHHGRCCPYNKKSYHAQRGELESEYLSKCHQDEDERRKDYQEAHSRRLKLPPQSTIMLAETFNG